MTEKLPPTIITARRTAWMEARARNAAKRGWLIASVGLLAVALTVLVLVLLPREVNRVLSIRIDALPKLSDTLVLQARLDTARIVQRHADSTLRALRVADADRVAVAAQKDDSASSVPGITPTATVAASRRDLGLRVTRARAAPLVESYRAVGESELLRSDANVRALLDSLNDVDKNREAYAALGGADARYAALTALITSLGQRIVVIAEQRLSNAALSQTMALPPRAVVPPAVTPQGTTPAAVPGNVPPASTATASAPNALGTPKGNASDSAALPNDTTALAPQARFNADSVADREAQARLDSTTALVVSAGQTFARARQANADIVTKRDATRAEFSVVVPPLAMVVAALVLGLAVGYGVALLVEVRKPRVADIAEVERVSGVRVIVHAGATRSDRSSRQRRRSDSTIPAVIDTVSDSYQLLHVTLTGFGDTARIVRIVSDSAMLTATVGINLAAAAAREARAALVVDADSKARLASTLLGITNATGVAESLAAPSSLSTHVARVAVGRDQYLKALFAGGSRVRRNEKINCTGPEGSARIAEFEQQLLALVNEHDLTVLLVASDGEPTAGWLPPADVILCVRLGATKLIWLTRSVLQLRASGVRLRAVLVWAADAPRKP
jgi:hypothetical protein